MSLTKENYFFRNDQWWFSFDKTATYTNNLLHSIDDKPALTFYGNNKNIIREEWYNQGIPHRANDRPAVIEYYGEIKKNKMSELYYLNGKLHRENNPAKILYNDKGEIFLYEHYVNGSLHNSNGPAYFYLHESFKQYKHMVDGVYHNMNGPASYKLDNNLIYDRQYYLFGKRITNLKKYNKLKFVYNKITNSIKSKRRKILYNILNATKVSRINGPDICNIITEFVY